MKFLKVTSFKSPKELVVVWRLHITHQTAVPQEAQPNSHGRQTDSEVDHTEQLTLEPEKLL